MKTSEYIPEQPFFEINTDKFMSRVGSSTGLLAQYYSFTISTEAQDAIVAVPDGTIDILFHNTEREAEAMVCGSVKKGKHIHLDAQVRYFGARFYPGAAEQLLECPLEKFTEQQISLRDVLNKAKDLIKRISSADTFDHQVEIFEAYQRSHLDEKPLPYLVNYILKRINSTFGDTRIQELADETGFSARHINNVFRKHVGISPKLYTRIVRFQRGFGLMKSKNAPDFAELAEEAGYYDQAHFINEFKEFSLTTPGRVYCN